MILFVRDSQCLQKYKNFTTEGIAVSMATSIPPHNMGELMDAAQLIINKTIQGEETDVNDLMQCIKGPDFPDGGIMIANNK